jgi:membrane protein required for colicin V production
MNWLDIVIVILAAISVFSGLKSGIVKALFTVVGVIVGVVLAGRFSDALGGAMTFISNPGIAKAVAFAVILIAVLIIATIAARLVHWALSKILLGWIDHLGGAVLGLLMGCIFCGAVLTMWIKFLGFGDTFDNSLFAGFLINSFPIVMGFLPAEFDSVRSFFD